MNVMQNGTRQDWIPAFAGMTNTQARSNPVNDPKLVSPAKAGIQSHELHPRL